MTERIEIADGLSDEMLAWIAETERKLDAMQRRIDAGEKIDLGAWIAANWIVKTTPQM